MFVNLDRHSVVTLDLPELPLAARPYAGREMSNSERDRLVERCVETNWNKSRAAEKLNWSRMTLYRKLAKYQLSERETAVPVAAPSL